MSDGNCTIQGEEWRPVVGYEDIYQVSNMGRVRSITRTVDGWGPWGTVRQTIKGKLLRPSPNGRKGYLSLVLHRNGSNDTRYVHRLVLEAFVGPCPEGMECRHFPDRNPANNRLDNLQWDTPKANEADKIAHGTKRVGWTHSQESRALIGAKSRGRTCTAETRAKMSAVRKGRHLSAEEIEERKSRRHSEESKMKMSAIKKEWWARRRQEQQS